MVGTVSFHGVNPPAECDVAVVGAGIVGLAVARELLARRPGARLVVLERETRIGAHQTSRNSGVVHAGIYYRPGSLKARLCVEGARELYEYCERRGIRYERCGKVIVAREGRELPALDELERRGRANGVPGLRRVGVEGLRELEPHVRGLAALHSPATGIVDFAEVAGAYAEDVRQAGGSVATGCGVTAVREAAGRVRIAHACGETSARHAVFCAGAGADRLAVAAGAPEDPRIVPFRGGYLRLRPDRSGLVRSLVYPVPDPRLPFLGVHLTRQLDGSVLIGPTALLIPRRTALTWPGTWRLARRWWRTGLRELLLAASRRALVAQAARFVPELTVNHVASGPSGVRAQAVGRDGSLLDDFAVSVSAGTLHVRNAPSPAATSSLALARLIADRAQSELGL
jgi:(S)-2-hydroxyglutarate dehydrogenase